MTTRLIDFGDALTTVTFAANPPTQALAAAKAALMGHVSEIPNAVPLLEAHYNVWTAGKTDDEIVAEVNALTDYHAAKSAFIYAAEPLLGTSFIVDGVAYTWTCITVFERGTACELYANVFAADGTRPRCMPFSLVRGSIAELPGTEELAALVASAITDENSASEAHANAVASAKAKLGLGG